MTEPAPPDPGFARLSQHPFPPYRHVPGLTPHPVTHPAGHLHGVAPVDVSEEAAALATNWRGSPQFCYGVDLYNFAYWWEAHEAWEALWHKFAAGDPFRAALQALIQTAAAHLKLHLSQHRGVAALLERARGHLDRSREAGCIIFGVRLEDWWRDLLLPYFADPSKREYPFLRPV